MAAPAPRVYVILRQFPYQSREWCPMFIQHRVKNLAVFFLATATSLLTFSQVPASGSSSARPLNLPVIAPVIDCAALASIDISAAVGAPTHIAAASVVNAKPAPYCKVEGYVEPAIKFEVHLPVSKWTQRLVQTGCGGLCGNLRIRSRSWRRLPGGAER